MQNSQLIVNLTPHLKLLKFPDLPWGVNLTPHLKLLEDRVNTSLFNVTNESTFETVN